MPAGVQKTVADLLGRIVRDYREHLSSVTTTPEGGDE